MFLGDGVRSILHARCLADRFLYGEHGPVMGCIFTILVASNVFGAEVIGSTPVLKIALPSSPLPSDRMTSRTIGHVHIGCYPSIHPLRHSRCTRLPEQLRRSIHRPQDSGKERSNRYRHVPMLACKWSRLVTSEAWNAVCRRFESDTLGTMIIFNTS